MSEAALPNGAVDPQEPTVPPAEVPESEPVDQPEQAEEAAQPEQAGELTAESLRDKTQFQIWMLIREKGGIKGMKDEELEALFPDPEHVTYNGDSGFDLRLMPSRRSRIELGKGGVKDGDEIKIRSDRDLAQLVKENIQAAGLEIKKPGLIDRAKHWARGVFLGAKRTGRLSLRGIRDGFNEGVQKAVDVVSDKSAEVAYGTMRALNAVDAKSAQLTRGVPLGDRNVDLGTGLARLDKTAEKIKNPRPSLADRVRGAVDKLRGGSKNANPNPDQPFYRVSGLKQALEHQDQVGQQARDKKPTLRERISGLKDIPWKLSRIVRGQAAKLEMSVEKMREGILDWVDNLPETPGEAIYRIRERIDKRRQRSWDRKVEDMAASKTRMEQRLNITETNEDTLRDYLLHFAQDFQGIEDPAQIVRELSTLLLNGKIGLSSRVDKYRKAFTEQGVDLKDIGDYMEFKFEQHLREVGDQKEDGHRLTGNQRLMSAKFFRFLQTLSPVSVSLDAKGERQAGTRSMKVELQAWKGRKAEVEELIRVLREQHATEESPDMTKLKEELKVLQEAEQNLEKRDIKRDISMLYTADGRTVGWYAGYALGLVIPGRGPLKTLIKFSFAGAAYGIDFAGGAARQKLLREGLINGDQLTEEAAQRFSNRQLLRIMKFSGKRVASNSGWNQFVRGFGGGMMLNSIFGLADSVHDAFDSTNHPAEAGAGSATDNVDHRVPTGETPAEVPGEAPETPGAEPLTPEAPTDTTPEVETPTEVSPEAPDTTPELPPVETPVEPEIISKTPDQTWSNVFYNETGNISQSELRSMAARILNEQFTLGDSITAVSPEATEALTQGMQQAIEAYQDAGTMDVLTPLQRLLLAPFLGDGDQVALAVVNNNLDALEAARIGSGGTIDWAPALEELKNMIGK